MLKKWMLAAALSAAAALMIVWAADTPSDLKTVVGNSMKAMGAENLKTLVIYGVVETVFGQTVRPLDRSRCEGMAHSTGSRGGRTQRPRRLRHHQSHARAKPESGDHDRPQHGLEQPTRLHFATRRISENRARKERHC